MRLIAALALTLLVALPADARSLSRVELRALTAALDAYSAALASGDAEALTNAVPARLLRFHAGLTGVELAQLKQAMTEQTAAMMADTRFGPLEADPAGAEATVSKLSDGTTVVWAILPASFTMEQDGEMRRVDQPVLALREGTSWFLLRVDPRQKKILTAVYPFLAEVELPGTVITPAG